MSPSLPVTVIGGYLGAGKTTLLNAILTQATGLRAAVLVNDFGSVNVDASLIRDHDGETISLENGCMCCSLTNGFASAMQAILRRADDLDHVVIEASGVAEPGRVAQYGQMYRLPLDGILTVVDAEHVRSQAANKYVGEVVRKQLAQADLILVNKIDLVGPDELSELRHWLDARAPGTPRVETVRSEAPLEVLLGRDGAEPERPAVADTHAHGTAYRSWIIERTRPMSRATLTRLARGLGRAALRAKGFVRLDAEPSSRFLYQQVGPRWTLQDWGVWGEEEPRTRIVVIALRDA